MSLFFFTSYNEWLSPSGEKISPLLLMKNVVGHSNICQWMWCYTIGKSQGVQSSWVLSGLWSNNPTCTAEVPVFLSCIVLPLQHPSSSSISFLLLPFLLLSCYVHPVPAASKCSRNKGPNSSPNLIKCIKLATDCHLKKRYSKHKVL